jgi:3,4-dihydroxy-2-butanone 4-phosphate synthase
MTTTAPGEPGDELTRAVRATEAGRIVVLYDDVTDGDTLLVGAAAAATTESLAFLVRHGSGYVCAAAPAAQWDRLRVPSMAPPGRSPDGVHFGVAVDAAQSVTTGISARDRAQTLRVVADGRSEPGDLVRPGHLATVRLHEDGLRGRPVPEEGAGELGRLADIGDVVMFAHLVSILQPTEIASPAEARRFADAHQLARVGLRRLLDHVGATPAPPPLMGLAGRTGSRLMSNGHRPRGGGIPAA